MGSATASLYAPRVKIAIGLFVSALNSFSWLLARRSDIGTGWGRHSREETKSVKTAGRQNRGVVLGLQLTQCSEHFRHDGFLMIAAHAPVAERILLIVIQPQIDTSTRVEFMKRDRKARAVILRVRRRVSVRVSVRVRVRVTSTRCNECTRAWGLFWRRRKNHAETVWREAFFIPCTWSDKICNQTDRSLIDYATVRHILS